MKKEIELFWQEMKKRQIQMCLVPTGDYHLSEYVDEYFKIRAFLSGFTGSAGTLLITDEKALLWTDGRYFIQAEKQLKDTGIELMKSGEKGVPTVEAYIRENLMSGDVLCFDGKVVSAEEGRHLARLVREKNGILLQDSWIDEIWENRPAQNFHSIERLGLFYTGRRVQEKLEMVREAMAKANTDCFALASLDDIAWLFNLRGTDIRHNPVFYSFAVITETDAFLFANVESISENLRETLSEECVKVLPYDQFYSYLETDMKNRRVLLDASHVSYEIFETIGREENKNTIIEKKNPTLLGKAVKTAVEADHIRKAHEIDALAMIRFLYWIKKRVREAEKPITELEAADYLDQLRLSERECLDISFETIAAYGENAAICHYSPDENSAFLKPEGFLLADSGGQYRSGTTDITRTIALGPLTERQKEHYTLVLKGNIRLALARFPRGVCGANLDVLAREPLWSRGLDYSHGTGHGVGYCLNVHEGPQNISWKIGTRPGNTEELKPGMLLSDEPGLYLEGEYGIRLENLVLVKACDEPRMQSFLEFETMTMVPFEREAILSNLLDAREREWLNRYHQQIYERYAKKVTPEERIWLRAVTEPFA